MDGARPDALSDAQLDRELEAALGVDPSPEFLARVRTRIAAEPDPSWRRLAVVASGFSRFSVEPLWAVAIAGIVLAIVVPQWLREVKPAETITDRRPTELPPKSVQSDLVRAAVGGALDRVAVRAEGETRSVSRIQKRLPGTTKVLISHDDRQAFDALLTAVAENRLPVRSSPVEAVGSSLAIAPLQIQQLRIEPLQMTGLEGVKGS